MTKKKICGKKNPFHTFCVLFVERMTKKKYFICFSVIDPITRYDLTINLYGLSSQNLSFKFQRCDFLLFHVGAYAKFVIYLFVKKNN